MSLSIGEMSSDAAAKLWDDTINRRLFELTHSQIPAEAFGGLQAIGTSPPVIDITFLLNNLL